MKRYILDRNILSSELKNNINNRHDLCVPQEVIDESFYDDKEVKEIKRRRILILGPSVQFFKQLSIVMRDHGRNTSLINLFTGKGTADAAIIAHVLTERSKSSILFPENWVIYTRDEGLIKVAHDYGIETTIVLG